MCGIAGIIYRDGTHEVGRSMTRMLQSMKHRGPDSTGYALYRPFDHQLVMRYKLADANTPRDFEFSDRLDRHQAPAAEVDLTVEIPRLEATMVMTRSAGPVAQRVEPRQRDTRTPWLAAGATLVLIALTASAGALHLRTRRAADSSLSAAMTASAVASQPTVELRGVTSGSTPAQAPISSSSQAESAETQKTVDAGKPSQKPRPRGVRAPEASSTAQPAPTLW